MIQLLPVIGTILDKIIPDEKANNEAKIKLMELAQQGQLQAGEIIKTEAQSEHWITATWRPILMLTFGALIVARWFGWVAPDLSEAEYLKLWSILELAIGGYTIGRTVEKIAPTITNAMRKN